MAAVSCGLVATSAGYAGDGSGAGKWRLSGGVSFRSIESDFSMDAPAALVIPRDDGGRGDVGLYSGTGILEYDDGLLGPAWGGGTDGTCYGTINSRDQLVATDRPYAFQSGYNYDELTFHSTWTRKSSEYSAMPYEGSDDTDVIAPFIQVRRDLGECPGGSFGLMAGYSAAKAELSSGWRTLAMQKAYRNTTTYAYAYDHVGALSQATAPGQTFPYDDPYSWTVYDPDLLAAAPWSGDTDALDPRQATTSSRRQIASFEATGCVDTDVMIHEIMIAPEFFVKLGDRVQVGLAVGPTLNVIDAEVEARRQWVRDGHTVVSTESVSEDSMEFKVGVGADLTAQVDLTERIFGQCAVGYRYVPSVTFDAGFASSEIDASTFQGSAGVGVRL
jgi:hypothetical protein